MKKQNNQCLVWKSVDESLPSPEWDCLVFAQRIDGKGNLFATASYCEYDGGWIIDFPEYSTEREKYVVTHWLAMDYDIPPISGGEIWSEDNNPIKRLENNQYSRVIVEDVYCVNKYLGRRLTTQNLLRKQSDGEVE